MSDRVEESTVRVSMQKEMAPPSAATAGVPRTLRHFLSRRRLARTLDEAASGRLIVVRGPGGSGKTTLLADWLTHHTDDERPIVWITLDESAHSPAGFWRRVVGAIVACGVAPADGPLADVLAGCVDLAHVPAFVLGELSKVPHGIRLVLDDLHLVEDANVDDIMWLLERSQRLQLLVTTRRLLAMEEPRALVRLEPTIITASQLAFDLDETTAIIDRSDTSLTAANAATIHEATDGHPLATRVAIAAFTGEPVDDHIKELERAAIVAGIATHAARDLLPAFTDAATRDVALCIALAPSTDLTLAAELSGRTEVRSVLEEFERDGFGEFEARDGELTFAFHSLVRAALEWEAERSLDAEELVRLRRIAARHLTLTRDPLGALRLYARVGDTQAMWPVIALNFSELINHHQADLRGIIEAMPPRALREEATLAIALAIFLSEQEVLPSARLRHLVETALEKIQHDSGTADPVERFWILLAIFAGLRAVRRYLEAAHAGDEVVAFVDGLSSRNRVAVAGAAAAGLIQIVITNVLVGRLDDAITLAHQLSHDPHPGRGQHRLSLLAYIQSMRGEMQEAEQFSGAVTQARAATWRATVPATGWHVAESLLRLERNDPKGAFEIISALDSRLPLLEHWPYLLWVKGLTRLAGPDAELGIDELAAAVRVNRPRAASPFALDLLGALQSDLYLAAGARDKAQKALDIRDADATPVVLAQARLQLAAGDPDEVKRAIEPLLWGEACTPRQQAEAFFLHTIATLRLGYPEEAFLSARRGIRMLENHRLRLPLIMVPQSELRELVNTRLPEHRALFDGLPDPFGMMLMQVPLTNRERLVLVELASAETIETIARRLFVSVNTVKTQLRGIYRKLGVTSREDAVNAARRRGLLSC